LHSHYDASPQILPGPPLVVDFLERLFSLRTAMGPRMTGGGCRSVSASALVQRLRSIGGRELNFKLMNLIPLGVSSPALRYREKLLQARAGGRRLWCGHGGIIPSFGKCSPASTRRTSGGHAKPERLSMVRRRPGLSICGSRRDDVRAQFSLGRQSACQQRGTHHGLGSPSDTSEECFLPA
jgi:hypothetical protein